MPSATGLVALGGSLASNEAVAAVTTTLCLTNTSESQDRNTFCWWYLTLLPGCCDDGFCSILAMCLFYIMYGARSQSLIICCICSGLRPCRYMHAVSLLTRMMSAHNTTTKHTGWTELRSCMHVRQQQGPQTLFCMVYRLV